MEEELKVSKPMRDSAVYELTSYNTLIDVMITLIVLNAVYAICDLSISVLLFPPKSKAERVLKAQIFTLIFMTLLMFRYKTN